MICIETADIIRSLRWMSETEATGIFSLTLCSSRIFLECFDICHIGRTFAGAAAPLFSMGGGKAHRWPPPPPPIMPPAVLNPFITDAYTLK